MTRIAIFSKYFGYNVGGAERSVVDLLQRREADGDRIIALVNKAPRQFNARHHHMPLPPTWEQRDFTLPVDFLRFRHIEYYINKPALNRLAATLSDIDTLYAYGNLAPALINAFPGKTVYLVRDEYGLGWNQNYHQGPRRIAQMLYHASEAPLRALWRGELRKAAQRSALIANSEFIKSELQKIAPRSAVSVVLPRTNTTDLARQMRSLPAPRRGIVAIGDSVLKGGDIVRKIARLMPERTFYLFDRKYRKAEQQGNLSLMPWTTPAHVYAHADLVIMPSRWAEAFGRVALEARALDIPVLASARGGLPEVIPAKDHLIDDFENPAVWRARIERILA